jgi:hypothetical protein
VRVPGSASGRGLPRRVQAHGPIRPDGFGQTGTGVRRATHLLHGDDAMHRAGVATEHDKVLPADPGEEIHSTRHVLDKRDRLDVMNGVIFPENLAFRADSAGTGLDLVDGNMWVERGATGRRGQVSLDFGRSPRPDLQNSSS